MKFQFEVPDLAVADLSNPSIKLQSFLHSLTIFCSFLASTFKTANGRHIFSAYVRKGAETVFDTDDKSVKGIEWLVKDSVPREREEPQGLGEPEDGEDEQETGRIVMDMDEPGNWVVLRFLCEGVGMKTLYAQDFMNATAEKSFAKVLQAILKRCDTTPRISMSLTNAIRELRKCEPQPKWSGRER